MAFLSRKIYALLLITCCLFFCSTLHAQRLFSIFAHGIYANPVDKNFKGSYNSGLGIEGGASIGWNKTFLVGTIGYTNFFHASGKERDLHYVPMKLGLRQYVFSKLIYIHGDLGIGRITGDTYNNQSRFSGNIGAGLKFTTVEVQVDYDGFTRKSPEPTGYASWIGLKAGFNLGL